MMVADEVIKALAGQVECYRRLARLAGAQHEHVQQSRVEELLEVLGKRQELLEKIAGFEKVIAPARKQWQFCTAQMTDAERVAADGMMCETRQLLEQITLADRDDALVLQQRKLNLGRQIGQATAAKQVNRNYAAAAYGQRQGTMDVQR